MVPLLIKNILIKIITLIKTNRQREIIIISLLTPLLCTFSTYLPVRIIDSSNWLVIKQHQVTFSTIVYFLTPKLQTNSNKSNMNKTCFCTIS